MLCLRILFGKLFYPVCRNCWMGLHLYWRLIYHECMDACFTSALNVCIDLSPFCMYVFGNGFINFHIIYAGEVGKVVRYMSNYDACSISYGSMWYLRRTLLMSVIGQCCSRIQSQFIPLVFLKPKQNWCNSVLNCWYFSQISLGSLYTFPMIILLSVFSFITLINCSSHISDFTFVNILLWR